MSISQKEQQALDSIESGLVHTGPELASKLEMFARLAAEEEMPHSERLWGAVYLPPTGPAEVGASLETKQAGARPILLALSRRAVLRLLWLVFAVGLLALALSFNHGTPRGICAVPGTTACQQTYAPAPAPGQSGVGAVNVP